MENTDFERLLKIARIHLTDSEKEKIRKDIEEIINYFNEVDKIDCDLKPAFHPIEIKGETREDVIERFDNVQGLLKNTKTYRNYVIGPKV